MASNLLALFPTPLKAYPPPARTGLLATLVNRIALNPFNAVATGIFFLAIFHTFTAARFTSLAHRVQAHDYARARAAGHPALPSVRAELLQFLGEVEVIFGLWAVVLLFAISAYAGWNQATHYLNGVVNYTEPLFVVVIMALASSRPIIDFAQTVLRHLAFLGGGTPAAWWFTILTVGPLFGSVITEPAAMTICALLLARQFYDLEPNQPLKYATAGLLFVNVSIGGTLTHFAAPPVLMVARRWDWNTAFMVAHFGWRAVLAIVTSNVLYFGIFRRELISLASHARLVEVEQPEDEAEINVPALLPVPLWITLVHIFFVIWTVVNSHYPALFLGGFLFFLGFVRATAPYQSRIDLRTPLLVGFFLAGLVIHGNLQDWWIAPLLTSLSERSLFLAAIVLTAFNDNALITYLMTLVPGLSHEFRLAAVAGAVTGGGLTVIANAPNPAGQALLARFFGGAIRPMGLALGALMPTLVAAIAFRLV